MKDKNILLLDLAVVFLILILPYYIFEGKLFIGGDETRLQYIYPIEWIKSLYFFSWYGYSPVGSFNPLQFTIPFLSLFGLVEVISPSDVLSNYLAFSLPLILGFLFFKKLVGELKIVQSPLTLSIGSLVYIFSPILLYKIVSPFLFAAWLIGFIPILGFLFIKFLKTGDNKYVFINLIVSIFLSVCFNSIPWILGIFLPLILSMSITFFYFSKEEALTFMKRSFVFFGLLILSQSFWLISFISSLFFTTGSYASSVLSEDIKKSFETTVLATSEGNNIIFPLLNLFHREIAFVSNWPLKNTYLQYYDYTLLLNIIFPIIIFFGILGFKRQLSNDNKRVYILILVAFLVSLFFFTVNIGPLKTLFLWLGNIPGFVMFRNFYGKFSLGYVLFFSIIITLSLEIFLRKYSKYSKYIFYILFFVILINVIPIKQLINIPLWKTENIYTTLTLPDEYLEFMGDVNELLPSTTTVLSLPLNIASYSIIREDGSSNIFAGSAPIKLFADVPSYSGDLSFSSSFGKSRVALNINKLIQDRNYDSINNFINEHNIGYVIVTKNIPEEAKNSYIFNRNTLPFQDQTFVNAITSEKLLASSGGNYELYKTRYDNTILASKNLFFEKVSPVKYRLYVKNVKEDQKIYFYNTFHSGWNLFLEPNPSNNWCTENKLYSRSLTVQCDEETKLLEPEDIKYTFINPSFASSHEIFNDYANSWNISKNAVIKNFDPSYYKENVDGSIDVEMVMYFVPQNFFYIGSLISILTVLCTGIWVVLKNKQ